MGKKEDPHEASGLDRPQHVAAVPTIPTPTMPKTNGKVGRVQTYGRRIQHLVTEAQRVDAAATVELQKILLKIQLCAAAIEGNSRAIELLVQGDEEDGGLLIA